MAVVFWLLLVALLGLSISGSVSRSSSSSPPAKVTTDRGKDPCVGALPGHRHRKHRKRPLPRACPPPA